MYSKWLPKTLKIAEKLIKRPRFYKRTLIITNFGPNLRYKSTQKQKILLSNIIVVVFVVESVNS